MATDKNEDRESQALFLDELNKAKIIKMTLKLILKMNLLT